MGRPSSPQGAPKTPQEHPKAPLRRPKGPQRGTQDPQDLPRRTQDHPRHHQDIPKTPQGPPKDFQNTTQDRTRQDKSSKSFKRRRGRRRPVSPLSLPGPSDLRTDPRHPPPLTTPCCEHETPLQDKILETFLALFLGDRFRVPYFFGFARFVTIPHTHGELTVCFGPLFLTLFCVHRFLFCVMIFYRFFLKPHTREPAGASF